MEIKKAYRKGIRKCALSFCVFSLFMTLQLAAQVPVKLYTVRDGKMHIELSKRLTEGSLDSFIKQFNLSELALKEFIRSNFQDSIRKAGWIINENTKDILVISKPLFGFEDINKPADMILFMGKEPSLASRFPVVSPGVVIGHNRFKNKQDFAVSDSTVTFFLRGNTKAREVILSGSFVNWSPSAVKMIRTDSGWVANLNLRPGKYWYKFIIDGHWRTDEDNLIRENDGLGNVNSVLYKTNIVFRFSPNKEVKKVFLAGSFNNWKPNELEMKKSGNAWELPVYLADGTHTYRFVADGDWYYDTANPDRLPNEFNDYNSVIKIGHPYLFTLEGYPDARKVVLTGSFNNWNRDAWQMTRTASGWELPYTLGPGNYFYKFIADGRELSNANQVLIIEPNYTFRLRDFGGARSVYLAGDFNNWDPASLQMKKEGDEWVYTVHLSVGKHLYKFIVDGKWIIDPANKLWEGNEQGTGNSVLWLENKEPE